MKQHRLQAADLETNNARFEDDVKFRQREMETERAQLDAEREILEKRVQDFDALVAAEQESSRVAEEERLRRIEEEKQVGVLLARAVRRCLHEWASCIINSGSVGVLVRGATTPSCRK